MRQASGVGWRALIPAWPLPRCRRTTSAITYAACCKRTRPSSTSRCEGCGALAPHGRLVQCLARPLMISVCDHHTPPQAKTHEKVDSIGEERSIACHAVVMLIRV
jgi:hypothetical protein